MVLFGFLAFTALVANHGDDGRLCRGRVPLVGEVPSQNIFASVLVIRWCQARRYRFGIHPSVEGERAPFGCIHRIRTQIPEVHVLSDGPLAHVASIFGILWKLSRVQCKQVGRFCTMIPQQFTLRVLHECIGSVGVGVFYLLSLYYVPVRSSVVCCRGYLRVVVVVLVAVVAVTLTGYALPRMQV